MLRGERRDERESKSNRLETKSIAKVCSSDRADSISAGMLYRACESTDLRQNAYPTCPPDMEL